MKIILISLVGILLFNPVMASVDCYTDSFGNTTYDFY